MSIKVTPRRYTIDTDEETLTHLYDLLWRLIGGTAHANGTPLWRFVQDLQQLVEDGQLDDSRRLELRNATNTIAIIDLIK